VSHDHNNLSREIQLLRESLIIIVKNLNMSLATIQASLTRIETDITTLQGASPGGSLPPGAIGAPDAATIDSRLSAIATSLDALAAGATSGNPPATGVPVITSPATASLTLNAPASLQVTASGSPTGFAATSLPSGLVIDPVAGLISGTPSVAGTTSVSVTASNTAGTSAVQTLVITVA
jgi:hypothetical protein